jgi:hypothetical protein
MTVNNHQIPAVFAQRKGAVVTGKRNDADRVEVGDVGARGPLGGQYRRANVVVAVAQEGLVQIEMFGSCPSTCSLA